jgi:hypothetical protein
MKQVAVKVNASPTVKKQWLAWMRTNHPAIYTAALNAAVPGIFKLSAASLSGLGKNAMTAMSNARSPLRRMHPLGFLGQDVTDLTSDSGSDDIDISSDVTSADYSATPVTTPVINIPSGTTTADTSSSTALNTLFGTVVAAAANVATNALTGNSAALVQENATRVAQGLPPLNPDGSVMSVAQMQAAGYTTAQIQTIENTLAGQGTLSTNMLLMIGGAVLVLVLMNKK